MAKKQTFDELRGSTPKILDLRIKEIVEELFDAVEGKTSLSRAEAERLRAEYDVIGIEQQRRFNEAAKLAREMTA